MNPALKKLIFLFLLVFGSFHLQSQIYAGSQLSYECISNTEYRITLQVYFNCAISGQDSVTNIRYIMQPFGAGSLQASLVSSETISQACSANGTDLLCDGGTVESYQVLTYQGLLSHDGTKTEIRLRWASEDRMDSDNLNNTIALSQYAHCTLYPQVAPCNNSPQLDYHEVPTFCTNEDIEYNFGSFVNNDDSLRFSFTSALVPVDAWEFTSAPYETGYMANPPFLGANIDSQTGTVSFNTNETGTFTIAILIEELDTDGNLIGLQILDQLINLVNCTSSPPENSNTSFNIDSGTATLIAEDSLQMCYGDDFCLSYAFESSDPSAVLTASTNAETILPNSLININGDNPITIQVCWEAAPDHLSGPIIVSVYDDNCDISLQTQEQFYLQIIPGVYAGDDQIYCPGQPVQLNASGSVNYTWTTLSGDGVDLFDCNDCPNPFFTPSQSSLFQVEGTSSGNGCSTTDEIEVAPTLTNNLSTTNTGCGEEDGSIQVEILDGSGNYSIDFDGQLFDLSGNSFDTTMLGAGLYNLTLIDESITCSISEIIEIEAIAGVPTPNISGPMSLCSLGAQLTSTVENTDLSWSFSGPGIATFSDPGIADPYVTVDTEGVYTIYLTESNNLFNCSGVDSIQIEFQQLEEVIAGVDTSVCSLSYPMQGSASNGIFKWFELGPGSVTYSSNEFDPSAIVSVSAYGDYSFLWTFNGINGCDTSGTLNISFLPDPVAESPDTLTFCQLDDNFLSATPAQGGQWSIPSGSFLYNVNDANSPIENLSGFGEYLAIWTVSNAACSDADTTILSYVAPEEAVINTTTNQVCGNSIEFIASNANGIWSCSNSDISFSPEDGPLTTISATSAGGYTILWTVGQGACASTDSWNMAFFDSATVDITSIPLEICSSDNISLSGTTSNNINQLWSTTGDGSFADESLLNTTYFPGVNDSINGTVTITLSADGQSVCPSVQESAIVIVVGIPEVIASASTPTLICSNATVVLNGNAINTTDILWTSSGDGQFLATPTMDDPTYFPGPMDTQNGSATLTISGNPLSSVCPVVSESINISIVEAPSSGVDSTITICVSTPSFVLLDLFGSDADLGGIVDNINGTGGYDGIDFNPQIAGIGIYEFSYTVIGLAPCPQSQSTVTIEVTPATNAGNDQSTVLCQSGPAIDLSDLLDADADGSGQWTDTDGSGALSGSIFTPSLSALGDYDVTYTVVGDEGCANDEAIITLTISEGPSAGLDGSVAVCESIDDLPLFDVLNGSPDFGGEWDDISMTGAILDGVFDPSDVGTGVFYFDYIVTLEGCISDTAEVEVNITPAPSIVIETTDLTLCSGESIEIDATSTNATSIQWSTEGSGGFFNPSGDDIEYAPSPDDIDNGSVLLTITANGTEGCIPDSEIIQLEIIQTPISNAGLDIQQCGLTTELQAIPNIGLGVWEFIPDVFFANENSPISSLTASNYGTYTLTWTEDNNGCSDSDEVSIEFIDSPDTTATFIECINTNTEYIISFIITGGDPSSYEVLGDGSVSGNIFASDPIATGDSYSFILNDFQNCSPLEIQGQFTCTSLTDAGTMSVDTLHICEGSDIEALFNNDAFLDNNDLLQFIVQDQAIGLGTILSTSNLPSFPFIPDLVIGEVYYINAIAGDDDGSGNVDLASASFAISAPSPLIVHSLPLASVEQSTASFCEGDSASIEVSFSGLAPYILEFNVNGDLQTEEFTDPSGLIYISEAGNLDLISLEDRYCSTTLSDQLLIEEYSLPNAVLPQSISTCSAAPDPIGIQLTGEGPWNFNLSVNGQDLGIQFASESESEIVVGIAGEYIFQNVSDQNCTNPISDTVFVSIIESPIASAGADTTLCSNGMVSIGMESVDGISYSWTNSDLLIDGNSSLTEATVVNTTADPITQSFTLTSTLDICSSQDEVIITVNPQPIDYGIIGDTSICIGDTIQLEAFGGSEYLWSSSPSIGDTISPSVVVYPMEQSIYMVSISNQFACSVADSIEIDVNPLPIPEFSFEIIDPCPPASLIMFNETPASEFSICEWSIPGGSIEVDECSIVQVILPEAGSYSGSLELTNVFGCRAIAFEDSIVIEETEALFAFFPENPSPDSDFLQVFDASTTSVSHLWTLDGDSVGSGLSPLISLDGLRPGYYELCLSILTEDGCADTLCKKFELLNNVTVWVPNTFTPDQDGLNDVFTPIVNGSEFVQEYLFQIFDRRGKIQFESRDIMEGWNAERKNGDFYQQSMYEWVVALKVFGEPYPRRYQGNVTLLK